MRLGRLVVRAFGPFAGEVAIDFDALAEAGLFHIHGPTGSGKTSLFDAVCFALYGDVPGVRRADRLRSDLADARTATSVELEFALPGGTFLVQRSPRQERPKRRGSGTTVDQESASLSARVDSRWVARAAGPAEVNAEVRRLLGLTASQFEQVVLLPQGRFQEALLAPTDRRRELLRTLFGTERFAAATDWLMSRADDIGRQAERSLTRVTALEDQARRRAAEAGVTGATTLPELAGLVALGRHESDQAVTDAINHAEAAARELREAMVAAERHDRVIAARAVLEQAGEDADEMRELAHRLERAGAAEIVAPLVRAWSDAADRQRSACDAIGSAVASARNALSGAQNAPVIEDLARAFDADAGDLGELVDGAEDTARTVDRLRAHAARLDEARAGHAAAEYAAAEYARGAEAAEADHEQWSVAAERCRHEIAAARVAAARLPGLAAERDRLAAAAEAARELIALRANAGALADAAHQADKAASAARHAHLDLLSRRIDGMAIELARQLAPDSPCPVCGSCAHPAPASGDSAPEVVVAVESIELAAIEAERLRRDADECRYRAARAAAQLDEGLKQAGANGADNPDACDRLAGAAADAHADALRTANRLQPAVETLAAAESSAEAARVAASEARTDSARAAAGALAWSEEARRARDAIRDALGETTLDVANRAVTQTTAFLRAAIAARSERDAAAAQAARLDQQLLPALKSSGFATKADVESAVLCAADRDALSARVRVHAERIASAHAVIDSLGPGAETTAPDLPPLRASASAAATRAQAASAEAALLAAADAELQRLLLEWRDESTRADTLVAEARQARTVADVCRGGGNQRHQALETYVLAAYCEEIAEVATCRLLTMTSGRYSLGHTDTRQGRQRAAGLDLAVHDAWSGQVREPSSLSGGELFQASLALALAVAEVVQRHTGGVQMQTLLIDEGFASLDADALDLAIAELDGLRAGGRTIGIISHVGGLRERIGVGLRIDKGVGGSVVTHEPEPLAFAHTRTA